MIYNNLIKIFLRNFLNKYNINLSIKFFIKFPNCKKLFAYEYFS